MENIYSLINNEIFINAPGSPNKNRIRNDLIWDLNSFLNAHFELFSFFVTKNPTNFDFYKSFLTRPKKYVVFQKLDKMFIEKNYLSDTEAEYYRNMLDPLRRMDDEVFRESCSLENVDIEYIAVKNVNQLKGINLESKYASNFNCLIRASFPVYVSLFGAKEVRIVINQSNLFEQIERIVERYCVKNN